MSPMATSSLRINPAAYQPSYSYEQMHHHTQRPNVIQPVPQVAGGDGREQDDLDRAFGDFPNVMVEPDHPLLLEARVNGFEKREVIGGRLFRERPEADE